MSADRHQLAYDLEQAIIYAELVAQHAPPGHVIHDEIARARDVLEVWLETDGFTVTPQVRAKVAAVMASMDTAVNLVRVDPDKPLGPARWTNQIPRAWLWAGAGLAVLVGVALFLDGDRS